MTNALSYWSDNLRNRMNVSSYCPDNLKNRVNGGLFCSRNDWVRIDISCNR